MIPAPWPLAFAVKIPGAAESTTKVRVALVRPPTTT
jgi:hypothetical protein